MHGREILIAYGAHRHPLVYGDPDSAHGLRKLA
jgi:hypothetical protein